MADEKHGGDGDGKKDGKAAYVREVAENTRAYLRELQQETARLRVMLSAAEAERLRLLDEAAALRRRLEERMRQSFDEHYLRELEAENRRALERYLALEQKNAHLANLYVASYRLHETLDRREVLNIIQEIIINLIGSEEHAVFELAASGAGLELLASMGIDEGRLRELRLTDDAVSRAVKSGDTFVAEQPARTATGAAEPPPVSACVPLKLAGKVTGAIVVYRLLPQKEGFEPLDRELFELLATHAAMALHCTKLHERQGKGTR